MFPDPTWRPFFCLTSQGGWGGMDQLGGKKQYSNDLWASEKWKSRHWQGQFCTGPEQLESSYQQLDCYSGWPPATGTTKNEEDVKGSRGRTATGIAKKWAERCTAKWKIAQSEWKCWPGIEKRNRSYPSRGKWGVRCEQWESKRNRNRNRNRNRCDVDH